MQQLVKNAIYKHYKGKKYQVIDVVRHSETLEELVLYKTLYENELGTLWVRPLTMFLENTSADVPRFALIENPQ